jgi:hypothetical protein
MEDTFGPPFRIKFKEVTVLFIMLYFRILLHCVDLTGGFLRRLSATSSVVPSLDAVSLHVGARGSVVG